LSKEKVTVEISKELYEKIKKITKREGESFQTVDAFVESVLDKMIREKEVQDKKDQKTVIGQLRKFGYF
jgi:hypothetical protein